MYLIHIFIVIIYEDLVKSLSKLLTKLSTKSGRESSEQELSSSEQELSERCDFTSVFFGRSLEGGHNSPEHVLVSNVFGCFKKSL